ncbi:MAG: DUF1905 domain-containing protein [Firmicutes bacterium]|nr:DUF1905 domain-containing protein [Bacillota bacterium]
MEKIQFDAVIKHDVDSGMDIAYIDVPMEISQQFAKGVVRVQATFDGEPYEGRMMRWATPHHMIGIRKDIRKKIGKTHGDTISVTIRT